MKNLKNQSGQMVVEYILILVVVVGSTYAIGEAFRSNELMAKIVSEPWTRLAGMIQNGRWGSPTETMAFHPSQHAMKAGLNSEQSPSDASCGGTP